MPSLYSRRPVLEDDDVAEISAIFKIPRLSDDELEAKAEELRARLETVTGRFKGWNVKDINPYDIIHGINERVWGLRRQPCPMKSPQARSKISNGGRHGRLIAIFFEGHDPRDRW